MISTSVFDIAKALKLRPSGFEHVSFTDHTFTKAFLACHDRTKPLTVIIGAGGSGKSVIYKMVAAYYGEKALCLAPTGIAAHNLDVSNNTAFTIHSALGLPVKPFYEDTEVYERALSALADKELLLIDEISMVSSNTLDMILRHVEITNRLKKKAEARIHTLLFGDPLQIGPVFQKDKLGPILAQDPWLKDGWDFFNSKRFWLLEPDIHVLKTVFRQKNPQFKEVLDRVRLGIPTDEDIGFLNSLVGKQKSNVRICPTNAQVDEENRKHIKQLARTEVSFAYDAEYTLGSGIRESTFSDHIEIFIGSRVMCTRNHYDVDGKPIFQNGTIGEVIGFEKANAGCPLPIVRSDEGNCFTVPRVEFTEGAYKRNQETGKLEFKTIASAFQIPLKACYAMTYHKCQGLTLPSAHLVLAERPQPGLLYMGLSRVKDPKGLTLSGKVTKDMFRPSESAKKFLEESDAISK